MTNTTTLQTHLEWALNELDRYVTIGGDGIARNRCEGQVVDGYTDPYSAARKSLTVPSLKAGQRVQIAFAADPGFNNGYRSLQPTNQTRSVFAMISTNDFSEIPHGLFLLKAMHERIGKHSLHLRLKINDGPWYSQPCTPTHSEEVTEESCPEFWKWAQENLPIYNYPNAIKSSGS